jgi:hypothetical protein
LAFGQQEGCSVSGCDDRSNRTPSVAQVLPGFHSEARWIRFAHAHLRPMFPYLLQRPAYNKRLRAALPQIQQAIRLLAQHTDLRQAPVWINDVLDPRKPADHLGPGHTESRVRWHEHAAEVRTGVDLFRSSRSSSRRSMSAAVRSSA